MSISLNMLEAKGLQANTLLNEANEIFPPVNPSPADDLALIMYRAGQRSVVEWLQTQMEQ